MIKSKCLFIDHKYHATTVSSRFFVDILAEEYDVEILFLEDFSEESLEKIIATSADLYVAFQYDFLAPFLLSNGKKTLIVPMYDGTGEMPPIHWLSMRDGLFLNFSEVLHKTHISLGLNSIYIKYYPNPENYPKFSPGKDNTNSIFFWERQPVSGLSVDWLAHQINQQHYSPKRIHIHQSPDPGQYIKRHSSVISDILPGRNITTSSWYDSKKEFLQNLCQFGIYIAPRKAEGIGFSFIDAMACGMVVFAYDKPTMNEYIVHGKNGIIFQDELPEFRLLDLEKLRSESMRIFEQGYNNCKNSIPATLKTIKDYSKAPLKSHIKPIKPKVAGEICKAFFRRQDIYLALIYNLIGNLEINLVWQRRISKPRLSTKLPMIFKNSPVLSQVLLDAYSKRKKIL